MHYHVRSPFDCSTPNRYLNQCWLFWTWSPRKHILWNFNRNAIIFIEENEFENVSKMATILSRADLNRSAHISTIWLIIFRLSLSSKKYASLWSFSQKVSTGFASVLVNMLIRGTFRCISIIYPKSLSLAKELSLQRSLLGRQNSYFSNKLQRWTLVSPHKGPLTRKTFLCHDVMVYFAEYPKI